MSSAGVAEFVYRVPGVPGGARPGAHRGRGLGPGLDVAAHRRLFDQPDPRRLDLRASLADPRREWLVRTTRQRAAVTLEAIVDVSASMHAGVAGGGRSSLALAADFLAALGYSAFRGGDAVGLAAFDRLPREDLARPPRSGRGAGPAMVEAIGACRAESAVGGGLDGLVGCAERLAGRRALVFVVSDFHFDLDGLPRALERFGDATVVPLVPWQPLELEPPAGRGWVALGDAESGRRRHVWLREGTRRRWRERAAARRRAIDDAFAARGATPFHMHGRFDAEALSRHFLEGAA